VDDDYVFSPVNVFCDLQPVFVLQLHENVSVSSSSLNFSNLQSLGYNSYSFIEDPDPRANFKIRIRIRNILNE
jgi:hypothetical protein